MWFNYLLYFFPHEYNCNKGSTFCFVHCSCSHHLEQFLTQRKFAIKFWMISNISWKQMKGPLLTRPTFSHENPQLKWIDPSTSNWPYLAASFMEPWITLGLDLEVWSILHCEERDCVLTLCLVLLLMWACSFSPSIPWASQRRGQI